MSVGQQDSSSTAAVVQMACCTRMVLPGASTWLSLWEPEANGHVHTPDLQQNDTLQGPENVCRLDSGISASLTCSRTRPASVLDTAAAPAQALLPPGQKRRQSWCPRQLLHLHPGCQFQIGCRTWRPSTARNLRKPSETWGACQKNSTARRPQTSDSTTDQFSSKREYSSWHRSASSGTAMLPSMPPTSL